MKKRYLILIQVALSLLLISSVSFAAPNINDGYFNPTEWIISSSPSTNKGYEGAVNNTSNESNDNRFYVNGDNVWAPGTGNQTYYDVEYLGLFIDDSKLYFGLQTNFDVGDGYNGITTGDLALNFYDINNPDDTYDFAIDLSSSQVLIPDTVDTTEINTKIFQAKAASDWLSPTIENHDSAQPWKIDHDSSNITEIGDVDVWSTHQGNCSLNRVLEGAIDLKTLTDKLDSFDANNTYGVKLHYTMSCGNDYLTKIIQYTPTNSPTSPVPEPATILLFGMGLLGAGAWGRKKINKNNKKA